MIKSLLQIGAKCHLVVGVNCGNEVRRFSSILTKCSVPSSDAECHSTLSSPLIRCSTSGQNENYLIFQQKRYCRFETHKVYNWKRKLGHKKIQKPEYRYDFRDLEGKEYTHMPLKIRRLGGRHPIDGNKINEHIGGGVKFDYFWIDYCRNRFAPSGGGCYEERVLEVRRAPNETAYVALVAGTFGRRWILATENMLAGTVIRSYNYIPTRQLRDKEMPEGDSWPVGALPKGTKICNIQMYSDAGNVKTHFAMINAGCSGTVVRQQGDYTVVSLKKNDEALIKKECVATIGRLSNVDHGSLDWGSMNMKRRWGIKQGTGAWHKKDQYCGRKAHPPKKVTYDEVPEPTTEKIPMTLSKSNLNALFGQAAVHLLIPMNLPEEF